MGRIKTWIGGSDESWERLRAVLNDPQSTQRDRTTAPLAATEDLPLVVADEEPAPPRRRVLVGALVVVLVLVAAAVAVIVADDPSSNVTTEPPEPPPTITIGDHTYTPLAGYELVDTLSGTVDGIEWTQHELVTADGSTIVVNLFESTGDEIGEDQYWGFAVGDLAPPATPPADAVQDLDGVPSSAVDGPAVLVTSRQGEMFLSWNQSSHEVVQVVAVTPHDPEDLGRVAASFD